MKYLMPLMLLSALLVSGCINGQSTQYPGPAAEDKSNEPWMMTVDDTAVLVEVVAETNWSIIGTGDLQDEEGFWVGIHEVGQDWLKNFTGFISSRYEVQLFTEDFEVQQQLPHINVNVPDNRTFEDSFSAGEYHFVLFAHNLTFDFTIESAEVNLIEEDREMFRFRTYTDGDWDYEMQLYVFNTLSYSEATTTIETNHNYIEMIGIASSLFLPNDWDILTRIGDDECTPYTWGPDWRRVDHRGTGDLTIDIHTETPDRGHHMLLWIFDLPLDPPEPYCHE